MLTFGGRLAFIARAAAVLVAAGALAATSAAAAAAQPAPRPATASGIVSAGVDDFVFESYEVDFTLDTDAEGHSVLRTVETFVAVFPEFDQNRGMRRAIPADYLGVPTDVRVISVTDENLRPRPMEVEHDDEGFVLVTSRASGFVHGRQTYVFTYEQRNVTRFFENTGAEEFYWDTNGTGWAQPFGSVTARVHVPQHLARSLTGQAACYQGTSGSTATCELTRTDAPVETVFETSVMNLPPRANLTVAIGFAPGTFTPRNDAYFASGSGFLQAGSVLLSAIAAIWALMLRFGRLADAKGRPTIIAEYVPPNDLDPTMAAVLLHRPAKATAAQIIDFAVRRRIRIIEQEQPGFFGAKKSYLLQLLDATGLQGRPLRLAQALFGFTLIPGTGYHMSRTDPTLARYVQALLSKARNEAVSEGYRKKGTAVLAMGPLVLVVLGGIGAFVFGVTLIENVFGGWWPLALMAPAAIAALIVFASVFRTPLTAKGAEVRDHLKGLELYITLAEADRMRVLQSPEGAERTPVSVDDPSEVLKLFEKLLPYAVIFGLEKRWAEELGKYYADESPDWYAGAGAFNAAMFASSIGAMSQSVSTSYSGSSSSSSSGGSGGGGSSGGGGGGGGGGGV